MFDSRAECSPRWILDRSGARGCGHGGCANMDEVNEGREGARGSEVLDGDDDTGDSLSLTAKAEMTELGEPLGGKSGIKFKKAGGGDETPLRNKFG
jgi:hypothetical protein